jgi:hypothetical protein
MGRQCGYRLASPGRAVSGVKSVVDFGGRRVINRKGLDVGTWQALRELRRFGCREGSATRELFEQKALQVIVVRRADGTAFFKEVGGRQAGFAARRFQCLGFTPVPVGPVKQLAENWRELGRQRESRELTDHALDAQSLLALFFKTGEGRLENFGWSLAETSLALAVEIDWRRMQGQE